jgi:conserved oligomeric Golgi complex subunit 2
MATHPTFLAFERRWQLPVYFQLRWKEIVTRLEDVLSTNKLELESGPKKGLSVRWCLKVWTVVLMTIMLTRIADTKPFMMSSSAAVWSAITTCWDRNVYVPQLAHRFWKLTLQILSRFRTWIESSLPPFSLDPSKHLPLANEKVCPHCPNLSPPLSMRSFSCLAIHQK